MLIIFLSHLALANAEGIFQYQRIDFFQEIGQQNDSASEAGHSSEIISDEWAEPVISPSGNVSVYTPPKQVKDFLDKPSPENARAYLMWNLKRIKKFILAKELLAKEAKNFDITKETNDLIKPGSSGKSGYLFYFMIKGCSFCEEESRVIEDIYLNHPEIRIEVFAKGFSDKELDNFRFSTRQDNGMSSIFKVETYPSIAVFNRKNQKYFLSGFVDKEEILKLFK